MFTNNFFSKVWLLVAFNFFIIHLVHADTISVRADEWYPINGKPDSDKPGYTIETLNRIFAQNGHQLDYKIMPWERSLKMVRDGDFNCVIGAYKDDAPDFIFPQEASGIDINLFYVRTDDPWKFDGLESLKDRRVGVIGGYAYEEEFDKYVEENKDSSKVQAINANNALEQNIKKLLKDRIDVLVESPAVLKAKLKEMNLVGKLTGAGQLGESTEIYLACSPNHPKSQTYVDLVSKGIRELRKNGELKKILSKYEIDDWKISPP